MSANTKTGDLVKPAKNTHADRFYHGTTGLVLKEDWRKNAPLFVMWKGNPRYSYWHSTNELVVVSESR